MFSSKNLSAMVMLMAAMLALSACGKRRTLDKTNTGGNGGAAAGDGVRVTNPTPGLMEGTWRSGCLATKSIHTMVVQGNMMTYSSERFSDAACTGPGQPGTTGRSNFTEGNASTSDGINYVFSVTYTNGSWVDDIGTEDATIDNGATPQTIKFSSNEDVVLQKIR